MTLKKPPPGNSKTPLPYPLSPEEKQQQQYQDIDDDISTPEPYSPSLLESPAFDLNDLDTAIETQKMKEKGRELPDALKVGAARDADVKRTSSELRRNYEKGDVPDALRPGAGRKSAEMQRPILVPVSLPPASDHCKPVCLLVCFLCATANIG